MEAGARQSHPVTDIVNEAETRRVISLVSSLDNPDLPRHMEHYNSNCGDPVTVAMVPSDPAATLFKPFLRNGHHS